MGISVEHIKTVKMANQENDEEFIIVFNENDPATDWIMKTEKNDKGNAIKWCNKLNRAQSEAAKVKLMINKIDEEEEEESDGQETSGSRQRKKKQLGGSIKALQKNDK